MKIEQIGTATLYIGDALEALKAIPDKSAQMCITSPPYYGLRNYGAAGQIGLERTPDEYIARLVEVFHEVKRILKDDGTLWINVGDSYAGSGKGQTKNGDRNKIVNKLNGMKLVTRKPADMGVKPKDLIGIPWMLAFALRADGWFLRQDIIWKKPNPMPESVKDRCTKSHEYIFLLSKSGRYYYDAGAIAEPSTTRENRPAGIARERLYGYDSKQNKIREGLGLKLPNSAAEPKRDHGDDSCDLPLTRNRRDVWTIKTKPYSGAHFAVFPPEIPRLCILAGSRRGDIVLDPFAGSGKTGAVAISLRRKAVLCELNADYATLIRERITNEEAFYQQDLITSEEDAYAD